MEIEIIIKHDDPERGVMVERYARGNYDEEGQFWRAVRGAVDRLDSRGARRSKAAASVPASAAPAPKRKITAGKKKQRVSRTPPLQKAVKRTARKLKRR